MNYDNHEALIFAKIFDSKILLKRSTRIRLPEGICSRKSISTALIILVNYLKLLNIVFFEVYLRLEWWCKSTNNLIFLGPHLPYYFAQLKKRNARLSFGVKT